MCCMYRQELVDELARNLGLVKVGWIFTDLVPGANGQVTTKQQKLKHIKKLILLILYN